MSCGCQKEGALLANASSIILAHNHPSGSTQPSHHDKKVTNEIKQAGEILKRKVLDHLILSSDNYLIFADEGLL